MAQLSRETARTLIKALRSGTVPPEGLEHFAVGLDPQVKELSDQRRDVDQGGSEFKFIRGEYGAGKTFLAALATSQALEANYAVSRVVVSHVSTPLYQLDVVYQKLCEGLELRGARTGAMRNLVDRWLYKLQGQVIDVDEIEDTDPRFSRALQQKIEQHLMRVGDRAGRLAACLQAYAHAQHNEDYEACQGLLELISGKSAVAAAIKKRAGITGDLSRQESLGFIRGLIELIRGSGHKGLVLVLDEVETIGRQRKPEKEKSLQVLRELVDEMGTGKFPYLQLLVTGTPDFFETVVRMEAPLWQRIHVEFHPGRPDNLRAAQIRLAAFDRERLMMVAQRVKALYPADHADRIQARVDDKFLNSLIDSVTKVFGGKIAVTPRLFLRQLVNELDLVDQYPDYQPPAAMQKSALEGIELSPQEEESLVWV